MKQKRYWLRGFVTGVVLGILLFVYFTQMFSNGCIGAYLNADGTIGSVCPTGWNALLVTVKEPVFWYVNLSVVLIVILVSTFVGWLYGKIKRS
jgi:hypothetical protein